MVQVATLAESQHACRRIRHGDRDRIAVSNGIAAGDPHGSAVAIVQRNFVDAVTSPDTGQRCQTHGATVHVVAEHVIDTSGQQSTNLGQANRVWA